MFDITDITNMTEEQLRELLGKAAEQIGNLEAERDSLKDECLTLRNRQHELTEDLQNTKKLNFTLARSLDTSKNSASVEDTLHSMFN